jgi:hypothetical protein
MTKTIDNDKSAKIRTKIQREKFWPLQFVCDGELQVERQHYEKRISRLFGGLESIITEKLILSVV